MKKTLLTLATVSLMLSSLNSYAVTSQQQDVNDLTASLTISGSVAEVLSVKFSGDKDHAHAENLILDNVAGTQFQPVGTMDITSNSKTGIRVSFVSQNNGALLHEGGQHAIPYSLVDHMMVGYIVTNQSMSAALYMDYLDDGGGLAPYSFSKSVPLYFITTGVLRNPVSGPGMTNQLVAGTYSDTITATISAI